MLPQSTVPRTCVMFLHTTLHLAMVAEYTASAQFDGFGCKCLNRLGWGAGLKFITHYFILFLRLY